MEENLLTFIVTMLCLIAASSEVGWDDEEVVYLTTYHEKEFPIHRKCASMEFGSCQIDCEMRFLKFVDSNNVINTDEIETDLSEEWDAERNEDARIMVDYVIRTCKSLYDSSILDQRRPCERSYQLKKCIDQEPIHFYLRLTVRRCLNLWFNKNDTGFTTKENYNYGDNFCLVQGAEDCLPKFKKYINYHGVGDFKKLLEETGLLSDRADVKEELYEDIKACSEQYQKDYFQKNRICSRSVASELCLMAALNKISWLFV